MDRVTKNVLEYEVQPKPHPWVVNFWVPLGYLLCITIVGLPIGIGIIAALTPKVQEHNEWKRVQKEQ